jgi:putative ABC transport system substrate-binding protein
MKRRVSGVVLYAMLFALCSFAEAQQPTKILRIGIVRGDRNEQGTNIKRFLEALQELGYVEGKNILFEYRYTQGSRDRAQAVVAELVNLKVDLLFSTQAIVVRAAKQAT